MQGEKIDIEKQCIKKPNYIPEKDEEVELEPSTGCKEGWIVDILKKKSSV